jgi:hypothetical protein
MTPAERSCKNVFLVSLVLAAVGVAFGLVAVFVRALITVLE